MTEKRAVPIKKPVAAHAAITINKHIQSGAEAELVPILENCIGRVRDELLDNTYIQEALKVLPVGGYRSAIGSFWNAVIDDLRNKVIHRSLQSFNREIKPKREVKTYEDFQNIVTDDELIEGSYKIGVIGWEARKMLLQAKQTRHIFDGHPKSSQPSMVKVLSMMDDCVKYVLSQDYPMQVVDLEEYLTILGNDDFDRNEFAVENALGDLPEAYKNELIHRLFKAYTHPASGSILKGNIEFIAPIFWRTLQKGTKIDVTRQVDHAITSANKSVIQAAFNFVRIVAGVRYLTITARKYIVKPIIDKLKSHLDSWEVENECVRELSPYSGHIPTELILDYVSALTHTYVGHIGHSTYFARTDFYADAAAPSIQEMFMKFDDASAVAFVECIKTSPMLQSRIEHPAKLRRLRNLCNIVEERISDSFEDKAFLRALSNEGDEDKFFNLIKPSARPLKQRK